MKRAILWILLLLISRPVLAQHEPLAGLDAVVVQTMRDWQVPGLAMAIVKDGRIVFERGFGVRRLTGSDPVDAHTLFAIGSTTKAMTAAAVGMLVDEKKLTWNDPVIKHLPWFQLKDPWVTRELKVRDLLTHRAGLGNADFLWYGQANSTRDILDRLRLLDPAYSMRAGFIYQNIMYAAAGSLIEAVSGIPWEDFIRRRIFGPLEMRDSLPTAATLAQQANVAAPHFLIDGTVRQIENASVDSVAAAGAVWSSAADMARWVRFLLDGGRIGGPAGERLLSEETVAELFKPQVVVGEGGFYPTARLTRPHWTTYAMGWFQQDYHGRAVDFHTGSIDGMVAIHGLLRDERLGVYILANLDHAELRHALMLTVFDRFTGAPGRDWNGDLIKLYAGIQQKADEARRKREAERITGTRPSLDLPRYAGTFADPLHGTVEVRLDSGRLRLRYGSAFDGQLDHWQYDTFRATWAAAWRDPSLVTFVPGRDGLAAELQLMGAKFTRKRDTPDR